MSKKEPDYHTEFVLERDFGGALSPPVVLALRRAWGCHHDDYAPDVKKFGTEEYGGGNSATLRYLKQLRHQALREAQKDMNALTNSYPVRPV